MDLQLYPFVRFVLCLAVGIVAGSELWMVDCVVWLAGLCGVLLLAWLVRANPWWSSIGVMLGTFFMGAALAAHTERGDDATVDERTAWREGVVSSRPAVHGKVLMCDIITTGDGGRTMLLRASIWNDERSARLRTGHGIRFRSRCEKPANRPEATFDYAAYLRNNGYAATTFIAADWWQPADVDLGTLPLTTRVRLRLRTVRDELVGRLGNAGLKDETVALVAAMTLGDKTLLRDDTKRVFRQTGVAHVLALSGLHLGLLYGLLTALLRGRRRRAWTTPVVVLTIWGYVLLTGMPTSIVRAALMLTIYELVAAVRHDRRALNVMAFAAFTMLVVNTRALYDVGFQLSFAAVTGILLLYKPLHELLSVRRWYKKMYKGVGGMVTEKVWSMVCVTVAAQTAVAPLLMYYFHSLPTYFVVTNLFVVPLVGVMVVMGACCWLLGVGRMGAVLDGMAGLLTRGLQWMASWPGAHIDAIYVTGVQTALLYGVMAALLALYMGYIRRRWLLGRLVSE